ncbi:MAG: hypothetical protein KGL63_13780 [Betaproteobacteria bacterium]|nr:hypothetical protein [Betaproteobacteria bacterium]
MKRHLRHFKQPHFLAGVSVLVASQAQNALQATHMTAFHQMLVGSVLGLYIMFLGRDRGNTP